MTRLSVVTQFIPRYNPNKRPSTNGSFDEYGIAKRRPKENQDNFEHPPMLRRDNNTLIYSSKEHAFDSRYNVGTCVEHSDSTNNMTSSVCQIDRMVENGIKGGAATAVLFGNKFEKETILFGNATKNVVKSKVKGLYRSSKNNGFLKHLAQEIFRQKLAIEEHGARVNIGFSAYIVRGKKLGMIQDVLNTKARPLNTLPCETIGFVIQNLSIIDCNTQDTLESLLIKSIENKRKHYNTGCCHFILNVWTRIENAKSIQTFGDHGKITICLLGDSRDSRNDKSSQGAKAGTLYNQQVQLKADLASVEYVLCSLMRQKEERKVDHLDLSVHCDSCLITRLLVDSLFCKQAYNVLISCIDASSPGICDGDLSNIQFLDNVVHGDFQKNSRRVDPETVSDTKKKKVIYPVAIPKRTKVYGEPAYKSGYKIFGGLENKLDREILDCANEYDVLSGMKFNKRSLLKGTDAHNVKSCGQLQTSNNWIEAHDQSKSSNDLRQGGKSRRRHSYASSMDNLFKTSQQQQQFAPPGIQRNSSLPKL